MAVLMPLKAKYRAPGRLVKGVVPETWVYQYSKHKSSGNNSGKSVKKMAGTGHRRKSYGPW